MNKNTLGLIIGGIAIGIVAAVLLVGGSSNSSQNTPVNNVTVADGKQIIEINVKGGYQPQKSIAQSGIPTIIRFKTKGTFDCSSSLRIPTMNIFKMLPSSGNTDIDIGTQDVSKLLGSCGMGMYRFEIDFT
jgi:plastocyanin domain-containing protein